MEPQYTKVNLEEWNRGPLFQHYIDNLRIVMSLTVDIDITKLLAFFQSAVI